MKTVNLIIGIHNHQPIGNFDFIFEEAYRKAYRPFLDVVRRFPSVKIGMHFTGIVLDWIDRTYPEFVADLKGMVASGQVEMIGGGFYEPILPVIPDHDKIGQIKKLSTYVEEKTGMRPQGMWMAERVWETHLPRPISNAGMKYVILDDTHFLATGLREEDLTGHFLSEEEGHRISIFPISKKMRYLIPFQEPKKTIEYLKRMASADGHATVVFADDGEKFGIWPETHRHVYEDGWLEKFLILLTEHRDWIRPMHFSEALKSLRPVGRVYLPNASYSEMQHWALPVRAFQAYEKMEKRLQSKDAPEECAPFVRGGFWRSFLVKYPESNRMHKKMLRLSQRIQMLKAAMPVGLEQYGEEQIHLLEKAEDHLWASQCNCPYWHGVFGGIYLNNIRYAVYREMLLAENLLDVVEYGDERNWFNYNRFDYDMDGHEEILIETRLLNVYINPEHGGSVLELDYKDVPINLTDGMTRREEGYHRQLLSLPDSTSADRTAGQDEGEISSIHDLVLTKEKNLHEHLLYDRDVRRSFVDRILPLETTLDDLYRQTYRELVPMSTEMYEDRNTSAGNVASVILVRKADWGLSSVELHKKFALTAGLAAIHVDYEIVNSGSEPIHLLFGTEMNFTMLAGHAEDRYYYVPGVEVRDRHLASLGTWEGVSEMGMADHWLALNMNLRWTQPATVWRYPVETVSLSEEGFERVYQNSCVFPHWTVRLKPSDKWVVKMTLSLSRNLPS